jgi:membrane-bound serine protease (ClpP class)
MRLKGFGLKLLALGLGAGLFINVALADHVARIQVDGPILVGTGEYIKRSLGVASQEKASAVLFSINTPGGILQVTQEIVEAIFASEVPVVIHVGPTGATATSAGVFILLSGHIAAMSPGTTLGAAHPVAGDGKDIEGDMRGKVENMAAAMIRSIAEQRKRNVDWAEKSVRESSSLTEQQAIQSKVVDVVASDGPELLKAIKGRTVQVKGRGVVLEDLSALPIRDIDLNSTERMYNFFSDPNVQGILWMLGTAGLSIELYNPGLILPGVVGLIALVIALTMANVVPIAASGVVFLILGTLLMGLEMVVPGGILGVGGFVAFVIGAVTLIDPALAPGLSVNYGLIGGVGVLFGGLMLVFAIAARTAQRQAQLSGREGLAGMVGEVVEALGPEGVISVNGEIWKAYTTGVGSVERGASVEVVGLRSGLKLEVKPIKA